MLKHLVKIGCQSTTNLGIVNSSYKYIRHGYCLPSSRPFSSEMAADWPQAIKDFLAKEKISAPTPIQEKTLPLAMSNKDLVGVARTGSGKTLAFVIPAVMKILKERENQPPFDRAVGKLPTCLVLAPTRELANQTYDVFKKFNILGIRTIVLVGGISRDSQTRNLRYKDQDVYIATPGRLKDLMQTEEANLSNIKYLVLDEADRMLDMGFEPQIRSIVSQIPKNRQTLMWSATWPREIQSLANEFMNDYQKIAVDSEKLKANPNISQVVEVCDAYDKSNILIRRIQEFKMETTDSRILVFVNTKRLADSIYGHLLRHRLNAAVMHGNKSQFQRDEALRLFKSKTVNILVATDVAARGLDISDVTHVINFDFPNSIEDYIHRIGRTARHDKAGCSLSLITSANQNLVDKLIQVLRETNQDVPQKLEQLAREKPMHLDRQGDRSFGRRRQNDFYNQQNFRPQIRRESRTRINIFNEDDDEPRYNRS